MPIDAMPNHATLIFAILIHAAPIYVLTIRPIQAIPIHARSLCTTPNYVTLINAMPIDAKPICAMKFLARGLQVTFHATPD